ncbi:MAG: hypothetical protein H0U64_10005 [Gemmatimonadaceae bacterium]|nr:hypothetical protein [Gemmatimonadaceae bacterium]
MFGCIRRLGCLVILLAIAGGAYMYMNGWRPLGTAAAPKATTVARPMWEPITALNAERGKRQVESLRDSRGPVYANLTGAEAASYIFLSAARQLPKGAENAKASVQGNELVVRAEVPLAEFGAKKVLGPLAGILGDKDTLLLGGHINVVQPGLGEFVVTRLKVGKLTVPSPLIPRLISEIRRGERPVGVAPNALPMPVPEFISDVRIANGRITVYKNAP